jgi:hypothetical protein
MPDYYFTDSALFELRVLIEKSMYAEAQALFDESHDLQEQGDMFISRADNPCPVYPLKRSL